MLGTVLIVVLILALLGALPRWSHSRQWGYVPTGGVGLVLLIVVVLVLLGEFRMSAVARAVTHHGLKLRWIVTVDSRPLRRRITSKSEVSDG